jgi:hypothetical protein
VRKSEEIKKGLECCFTPHSCGGTCPYDGPGYDVSDCTANLAKDALTYIEQLEEQIMMMKIQMHGDCGVCKHRGGFDVEGAIMSQRCYECLRKETRPNWEYEGLPEVENKCR